MQNEVIEKLQKILALANCKGATEGEMQAALARAREIAIKHGIDLAAVPAREDNKVRVAGIDVETNTTLKTSTRYVHPYHNWVLRTLEDCFGVKFLISASRIGSHPYWHTIYIIGEKTDVAIVLAVFPWLESLFPSLYHKAKKRGLVRNDFASQNGFYLGLYQGIVESNKREEKKLSTADRSQWALVVRDKNALIQAELDKHNAKEAKQSRKQYNFMAIVHGEARGKQINLNQVCS